jgi:hypothetical protein
MGLVFLRLYENGILETKILISSSWDEFDFDVYYFDDDEDESYDRVGYDYDGDLEIDEYQTI